MTFSAKNNNHLTNLAAIYKEDVKLSPNKNKHYFNFDTLYNFIFKKLIDHNISNTKEFTITPCIFLITSQMERQVTFTKW